MKIIDAFWEKRNLGVSCTEIMIEKDDHVSCVDKISSTLEASDYLVVKVPIGRFDINESLTQNGFVFVEGSINFHLNVKDAILSPLQQRLNNVVTYSEMTESDLIQLFNEIGAGMFKTDRILLDSCFTEKQAATRYVNWIKDEIGKAAQVYKIVYKEDSIGFFAFKKVGDDVYYPFLAGLYEKFANSGLGFATLRKPIEEAIKRNGKAISTYVSTNNHSVLRAHTQQGFSINELQYVFVKHTK